MIKNLFKKTNPYEIRAKMEAARRECHPGHEDMAARNFGFKSFLDLQEKARQEAEQFALPSASQAAAARAEATAALEKAAEAERAAFEEEQRRRSLVNRNQEINQKLEYLKNSMVSDEQELLAEITDRLCLDLIYDHANRASIFNLIENVQNGRILKGCVEAAISKLTAEQSNIGVELSKFQIPAE